MFVIFFWIVGVIVITGLSILQYKKVKKKEAADKEKEEEKIFEYREKILSLSKEAKRVGGVINAKCSYILFIPQSKNDIIRHACLNINPYNYLDGYFKVNGKLYEFFDQHWYLIAKKALKTQGIKVEEDRTYN